VRKCQENLTFCISLNFSLTLADKLGYSKNKTFNIGSIKYRLRKLQKIFSFTAYTHLKLETIHPIRYAGLTSNIRFSISVILFKIRNSLTLTLRPAHKLNAYPDRGQNPDRWGFLIFPATTLERRETFCDMTAMLHLRLGLLIRKRLCPTKIMQTGQIFCKTL
jgi:hypothetical protein